jgi:hypothetical protein
LARIESHRNQITLKVTLPRTTGTPDLLAGVEQLEKLRVMGCDAGPGYLFSNLLSSDAICQFVALNRSHTKVPNKYCGHDHP